MPVMEGKCALFKAFGDVDAFPLCVKSKDVDEFVNAVYLISDSSAKRWRSGATTFPTSSSRATAWP